MVGTFRWPAVAFSSPVYRLLLQNNRTSLMMCLLSKFTVLILYVGIAFYPGTATALQKSFGAYQDDSTKRKAALKKVLARLPPEITRNGPVSFYDNTFSDWLTRTRELPPDFDSLPSIPLLPDPLTIIRAGKTTRIAVSSEWRMQREVLKKQIEYYFAGTSPTHREGLSAKVILDTLDGQVRVQTVVLRFGPSGQAQLTVEIMIPPGKGPLPVFLTQWNHREWAQIAVKRGYVACVLATADTRDDTEEYARIWAGQHDFSRLARRAYGTSAAIDYLYTLPWIDKKKIGMAGHSRNGKLSLLAAAFDERISAVVVSSGGSGAEIPWRYTTHAYVVEDIGLLTSAQPAWFHPRLRFFAGNENKLPVDQNTYLALIAPRAVMIATSINESASNPWGAEQAVRSALGVYKLLGAESNITLRFRNGFHGTSATDIEAYLDFFEQSFQKGGLHDTCKFQYSTTFQEWKAISKETINPLDWSKKDLDDICMDGSKNAILSVSDWEKKKTAIHTHVNYLLGTTPPTVTNAGPATISNGGDGEDNFGSFLPRAQATSRMAVMKITPYKAFGDYLHGNLYYPKGKEKEKLSTVIYLHPYDYSKGFSTIDHQYSLQKFFEKLTDQGFAVFAFDLIGFGNRLNEGSRFYQRYPHWSKLGSHVSDIKSALTALSNMEMVDKNRIYAVGYALGGTAGLFTASLDTRLAGVAAVTGFAPMRTSTITNGTEGIRAYADLHGLLPRLGFFYGHESRIPVDFPEIIASLAPRPMLLIQPKGDQNVITAHLMGAVENTRKIYDLYPVKRNAIEFHQPDDGSQFSLEIQELIFDWLQRMGPNRKKE
jgi:dienelactone hydrolase